MAETTDGVAPALSADEWERMAHEVSRGHYEPTDRYWIERPRFDPYSEPAPAGELRAEVGPHDSHTALRAEVTLPPVPLMALGNAVLPDGHPAKITRADVDALLGLGASLHPLLVLQVEAVAAKLAALLPPETPDGA